MVRDVNTFGQLQSTNGTTLETKLEPECIEGTERVSWMSTCLVVYWDAGAMFTWQHKPFVYIFVVYYNELSCIFYSWFTCFMNVTALC